MFNAVSLISVGRTGKRVGVVPAVHSSVAERPVVTTRPLWLQRLGSIAGLVLVVWAVPLLVLAVPLALLWRAGLEVTTWRNRRRRSPTDTSSPVSTTGTWLQRLRTSISGHSEFVLQRVKRIGVAELDSRAHRVPNPAETHRPRLDSFPAGPSLSQTLGYLVLILISGLAFPIFWGFQEVRNSAARVTVWK